MQKIGKSRPDLAGSFLSLGPFPWRLNQMHRVIGIATIIIEVRTKGPESNVPQAAELDLLNILRSDPYGTLHIFLQLFISIATIHISPPLSRAPTDPPETPQAVQAYTSHRHCTRRIQPAMSRHRDDLEEGLQGHGRSEYPNRPRSGGHALAHSRSAISFSAKLPPPSLIAALIAVSTSREENLLSVPSASCSASCNFIYISFSTCKSLNTLAHLCII